MSIDDEWENFLDNVEDANIENDDDEKIDERGEMVVPDATDIYISTKTKIIYLTEEKLDIDSIFWKIPVTNYDDQEEGIIKKQMKIVCKTKEHVESIEKLIESNFPRLDAETVTSLILSTSSPTLNSIINLTFLVYLVYYHVTQIVSF
jgi:hypothetical protein